MTEMSATQNMLHLSTMQSSFNFTMAGPSSALADKKRKVMVCTVSNPADASAPATCVDGKRFGVKAR